MTALHSALPGCICAAMLSLLPVPARIRTQQRLAVPGGRALANEYCIGGLDWRNVGSAWRCLYGTMAAGRAAQVLAAGMHNSFGGGAAHGQRINHGPAGIIYCGPPPRCLMYRTLYALRSRPFVQEYQHFAIGLVAIFGGKENQLSCMCCECQLM